MGVSLPPRSERAAPAGTSWPSTSSRRSAAHSADAFEVTTGLSSAASRCSTVSNARNAVQLTNTPSQSSIAARCASTRLHDGVGRHLVDVAAVHALERGEGRNLHAVGVEERLLALVGGARVRRDHEGAPDTERGERLDDRARRGQRGDTGRLLDAPARARGPSRSP